MATTYGPKSFYRSQIPSQWGETSESVYRPITTIVNLTTDPPTYIVIDTPPEDISDNTPVNFDLMQPMGRSSAFQGYNSSGPRSVSFTFTLHADAVENNDLVGLVHRIEALNYPSYRNGIIVPPMCYVSVGSFLRIKGYCTANVTWRPPIKDVSKSGLHGYPYRGVIYMVAEVSLDVTESVDVPYSAEEVAEGRRRYYWYHG